MAELSIAEFVARLAEVTIATEHETRAALEESARLVESEAKSEIGDYQPEAGPFAAWAELADATKQDRVAQGYSENDPLLRSGALRESIEHTVMAREAHVGSNSPVAIYQERGTGKITARSFLGGALFRKQDEVAEVCGRHFIGALAGRHMSDGEVRIPLGSSHSGPDDSDS